MNTQLLCIRFSDYKDARGRTPLMHAALNGNVQAVKGLIKRGADLSLKDKKGWNALHFAADAIDTDVIDLILTHMPNIESKAAAGSTPLIIAVRFAKMQSVKHLLERGANPLTGDNDGQDSLVHALSRDYDVLDLLLSHVAKSKNFELTFVGSSPGEHRKVEQWFLNNTCINRNQLTVRGYCCDPEELKMMFYQSDLVALPSRTEGFGLVALEAISGCIPVLVSCESGVAEALKEVEGGCSFIMESDGDAQEWAQRIREMSELSAEERDANAVKLRENYRKVYP
ncbi:Ankyrin repeat and EF-hand domain-containing protein 1 [Stylophora pistillata]|uniref:Ankyrin repeat and EF-hand domain-containing protein 1 n=1 Tax=Stylophora pistillata TaxID=50429 RepID=A0A2B4RT99_STYPI|nr:Ankyrin repeat and EF-hand domain-containing protein 1 [Stylophora pistillata]